MNQITRTMQGISFCFGVADIFRRRSFRRTASSELIWSRGASGSPPSWSSGSHLQQSSSCGGGAACEPQVAMRFAAAEAAALGLKIRLPLSTRSDAALRRASDTSLGSLTVEQFAFFFRESFFFLADH